MFAAQISGLAYPESSMTVNEYSDVKGAFGGGARQDKVFAVYAIVDGETGVDDFLDGNGDSAVICRYDI